MKKAPTTAESAHMIRVKEYGCLACRVDLDDFKKDMPLCEAHHIQFHGGAKRHWAVIGLCAFHHTEGQPSIHGTKADFRAMIGTEWQMLMIQRNQLKEMCAWSPEIETSLLEYLNSGHVEIQASLAFLNDVIKDGSLKTRKPVKHTPSDDDNGRESQAPMSGIVEGSRKHEADATPLRLPSRGGCPPAPAQKITCHWCRGTGYESARDYAGDNYKCDECLGRGYVETE